MQFQSTRPRGARPTIMDFFLFSVKFQSTRPRGARHINKSTCIPSRCFNPRAREGRDERDCVRRVRCLVSIHAPARGATRVPRALAFIFGCFNPRAREGRDAALSSDGRKYRSFNPRAREGRDAAGSKQIKDAIVSIHAPARGATGRRSRIHPQGVCFNPRAREGRDLR